ncbi:PilZ domain-containing protein [Sporosarcina trichiuri]|uniref:PilZ domain-containing protein n=1 Tax=Sporosarcina trichiuri TaxID=3056445 RepID=UPI0025B3EF3E|nr:PilZ domain-containing protein [Sporosarcina sp. 0.2-SM1T-5]WJY26086.1 PilZ domain-containing protein [Sporosarcina sp. 0.2-SM1T-5]
MHYKRDEAFRFPFSEPVPAEFSLYLKKGSQTGTGTGDAVLLDISPGGTRMRTAFDIPVNREEVAIRLRFNVYQEPIATDGVIVWKEAAGDDWTYGIDFDEDALTAARIVSDLKLRRQSERT